ncbi:hypothetical protein DdX_11502 [Ditylenchus destructor]|uniref:Uncharacterized protein n=1 Tax=Ditylenchus destructor TaxID=166010 RepID=A0AAD4MWS2_9BILA|nr:hypothetical protein DdX_11502 [Ditylenchus destructor]
MATKMFLLVLTISYFSLYVCGPPPGWDPTQALNQAVQKSSQNYNNTLIAIVVVILVVCGCVGIGNNPTLTADGGARSAADARFTLPSEFRREAA